ncbi:hypothetical protein Trydic_g16022 [Trypoxylus dichotomus]
MYVENKVALITGGAVGLGYLYAEQLLKNGLRGVTLADVNVEKGEESAQTLTKQYGSGKVIFIKVDVVDKAEFENAIKKTIEIFGNFDILINNAGIFTDAHWEKEIDINLKGAINGSILGFEEYLPKYKTDDGSEPTIINISSIAGLSPSFFTPVYSATKTGIIVLSKALATPPNYESQKVRIVVVCPGCTTTTMVDNLDLRSFSPRHVPFLQTDVLEKVNEPLQTPEVMAAAMIKIIENAQNGDVWVVRGETICQIEVPTEKDMKILKWLE